MISAYGLAEPQHVCSLLTEEASPTARRLGGVGEGVRAVAWGPSGGRRWERFAPRYRGLPSVYTEAEGASKRISSLLRLEGMPPSLC